MIVGMRSDIIFMVCVIIVFVLLREAKLTKPTFSSSFGNNGETGAVRILLKL